MLGFSSLFQYIALSCVQIYLFFTSVELKLLLLPQ